MAGKAMWRSIGAWISKLSSASLLGGFIGALIGALIVAFTTVAVSVWEQKQHRQEVISAFIADVGAMRAAHEEWLPRWRLSMDLLSTVDALKNEGGRPWLMPEFRQSTRLAIYEANAGNLGALGDDLSQAVGRFYLLTKQLNAEIQILSSPSILGANRTEAIKAIEENDKTMESWRAAADDLLEGLRAARDR